VVATIFPIADLAAQIGGTYVHVTCLLPPGVSPHGFAPKPADVRPLRDAKAMFTIGMGIDGWAHRALAAAQRTDVPVIALAETASFKRALASAPAPMAVGTTDPDEHQGDHDHSEHMHGDGHFWLDPVLMQDLTRAMAEALARLDPAHDNVYRENADAYIVLLGKLHEDYARELAPYRGKTFVTFHEAFGCTAARYGLRAMAIHDAGAGGFGPAKIDRVLAEVRSGDARAIFAEPQFPRDRLEAIASRSGLKAGTLDPEGNPHVRGYDSYLNMMRSNLRELVAGLKE
jgi:ABC-type Zn uptake system ZnuABC Zn-binding protein ZnuA